MLRYLTILGSLILFFAIPAFAMGPGPAKNGEIRILGDITVRETIKRAELNKLTKQVSIYTNDDFTPICEIQASSIEEAGNVLNTLLAGGYIDIYANPNMSQRIQNSRAIDTFITTVYNIGKNIQTH